LTLTLSSFLLLLSILLVLVSVLCCVAGRYCFRLIAAVVVDFSLLLFTHTHTCRSFSFPLFYCQKKKNEQYFYSSYINVLILILSSFFFFFFLCHNSSFPFYFNLICCIPFLFLFLIKKTFFYFPSFFSYTQNSNVIRSIRKSTHTPNQQNQIKTQTQFT
jgi:hypothetical protein